MLHASEGRPTHRFGGRGSCRGTLPGKTSLSSWLSLLDARREGPDGNAGRFYMDGWRLVLRAQAW